MAGLRILERLGVRSQGAITGLRLWNRIRKRAKNAVSRPECRAAPAEGVAVLTIFKNESHLIEEWLQHYIDQGVDRIFLIDNGSTDDTAEMIARFPSGGRAEVISLPEQHRQQQHYWTAFQHFRIAERCEWLVIADIDEFWFCKSGETLASYVQRQSRYDGIYAHWTNFGSGGLDAQPKSVRQSLVHHDPRLGPQTKCIFRTFLPQAENDIEVHFVRNLQLGRALIADKDLQLNHYVTQSRAFWFGTKMTRGDVFYTGQNLQHLAQRFDMTNRAATSICTRLRNLVEIGFKS